jgi:gliding motility-associated protein GldM
MAGGKETPRQKMIGMMYLVLTALLAMNISKDVLNAFLQINKGLLRTSEILEEKSKATLLGLNNPKDEDKEKAIPFQQKAKEVADKSEAMVAYMQEIKARVMACSMKGNPDGSGFEEFMVGTKALDPGSIEGKLKITKPDENQNNTTLLIGSKPQDPRKDPWSAVDLRTKLEEYRDWLKTVNVNTGVKTINLSDELVASIDSSFSFKSEKDPDGLDESWEVSKFYHSPLVAVIATLTKIETDVMNAKTSVISYLASNVNATDLKFTDVTVAAVPLQSYVLKGDEFQAEIYLAAYNKNSTTKIYPGGEYSGQMPTDGGTPGSGGGGGGIASGPDGKCIFKVNTGGMSLGQHGFSGQISYLKDGKEEFLKYYIPPFTVGAPALVVSPKQMNVFYRGLDNPVEISVPGVSPNQMQPSCEGCEVFTKVSDGEWNVRPAAGTVAKISVTAEINGTKTSMGTKEFRVKKIPDPVPSFNGKRPQDSSISQGDASVGAGLKANMEGFDFPVTANVISFRFSIAGSGGLKEYGSDGPRMKQDASEAIKKAKKGEKIFFEEIMCNMPDGTQRKLSPITLKII